MPGPGSSLPNVVSAISYYGGDRFKGHSSNMLNSGTVAGRQTEFLPVLQGGNFDPTTNTFQSGSLTSKSMKYIEVRGTPRSVTTPTYLSITGKGKAVVESGGKTALTDTLSFKLDNEKNLQNHLGDFLQGFRLNPATGLPIAPDTRTTGGLETVSLNGFSLAAKPTSNIGFVVNLQSNGVVNTTNYQMPVTVFDSLGMQHTLTVTATLTAIAPGAGQTWNLKAASPDGVIGLPYRVGQAGVDLTFNGAGLLTQINGGGALPPLTVDWAAGGAAQSSVVLGLGTVNQRDGFQVGGTQSIPTSITPDGQSGGNAIDLAIDQLGKGTILFDNGVSVPGWQVPIALVDDFDQLQEVSGGTYSPTLNSGSIRLYTPGSAGVGKFVPSTLEESSVDATQALTDMIIDNSRYTQCLKVITTVRQMLDRLNEL